MYYSNGNYEAFARPRKPEGIEQKHAYIIGAGWLVWQRPSSWFVMLRCLAKTFIS